SNSTMTVEMMVKSKGLELKTDVEPGLPHLLTDILKIKQIVVNLLSNAVKFTEQGNVTIKAFRSGDMVGISIKDSGIGIEKKNLELVFEEFQQIDTTNSRKYKGTGLGLPISRKLARLLGGELVVESEYGKGSTFILTIPPVYIQTPGGPEVAPPPKIPPARPPQPANAPRPLLESVEESTNGVKILCIDDDPDALEILRKYLVPEGYAVTVAYSGDEGIKLAQEMAPALITLDIMMPQKDGWQVLRELKRDSRTRDIPVIIHSMIDNKPLAMSLGAIDVMPKPVESTTLLSLVQRTVTTTDQYVLVVDDNRDYTVSLRKLLEKEGFKGRIANTGEEALEILKGSQPAMILLDLVMPGMDGFEVLRKLGQNTEWRKIPVVILSGKELTEKERENFNANIREYLNKKEFSQEAISSTIKRILTTT
ncbi:MAG: response regulator, partial [Bacteroidota bacterium]